MSKLSTIQQLKTHFETFDANDVRVILEPPEVTIAEWDGLDKEELMECVDQLRTGFRELIEKELLANIPFNALNAIRNHMQKANSQYTALSKQPVQQHFQPFAQQVAALNHQAMMSNIDYLIGAGTDMAQLRNNYKEEIANWKGATKNVTDLELRVNNLIDPSIVGSLSNSFRKRKWNLFWGRMFWGAVWIISTIFAIKYTTDLAEVVSPMLQATEKTVATFDSLGPMIFIRTVTLVPIYLIFGFSFSQYRKERSYEEEYAHKEAVASALPNYGRLAEDEKVRDQMITFASNVIFSSPVDRKAIGSAENDTTGKMLDAIDNLAKSLKKDSAS